MEKKTWSTPKLITVVRSKPEECVLSVCKQAYGGSGTPATTIAGCDWRNEANYCVGVACAAVSAS